MENQKLQKSLLLLLKDNPIHMVECTNALVKRFQIQDISDKSVACNLKLLKEKGLIAYRGELNLGSFLELSEKGYRNFDHWTKKLVRYLKKNFFKILGSLPKLLSSITP